jgi:hypothetical protein
MSIVKPYGLTPFEVQILRLTVGAGRPIPQSALAMMTSSLFNWKVKIGDFRPRLLKTCAKGLVRWKDWGQGRRWWGDRIFVETELGDEAIRDSELACGGDYSYYKYFKPNVKESLDRYTPHKVSFKGASKKGPTKKEVFQIHYNNVKKNPKKFFWR